ncbi:(2Fe-2S)-binding protein [Caballeronia megalochromosomata]|nr:(2Fe-2S)-binding protein [Caballeronia megalochromosomata]
MHSDITQRPAPFIWSGKSLGQARSMPGSFYTSREVFEAEREHIFLRHWFFVGRADELGKPGSYRAIDTAGGPVVLTRDENGELHAFANTCRHRGAQLLEGCGAKRSIVCPYHAWSYRLDGTLLRAPGTQDVPGFDPAAESLIPVRMRDWKGNLFLNFDDAADDLETHLGTYPELFASHRVEEMRCVFRVDLPAACNWKMLLENAMETYHTGLVHARTVGAQISLTFPGGSNWHAIQVQSDVSTAVLDKSAPPPFPQIDGLSDIARKGTFFTLIEPLTQLVFAQDCMWWLAVHPVAADRSVLSVGGCFPRAYTEMPDFDERARPYFERWEAVAREDVAILERQQRGVSSVLYKPGVLSSRDDVVHTMNSWVAARLPAHLAGGSA